ncbi:hypothetical protein ACT7DC_01065, partial [Bacillus cereus]
IKLLRKEQVFFKGFCVPFCVVNIQLSETNISNMTNKKARCSCWKVSTEEKAEFKNLWIY